MPRIKTNLNATAIDTKLDSATIHSPSSVKRMILSDDGEWMLAETFFLRYLFIYIINHEASVFFLYYIIKIVLLDYLMPKTKIT